LTIRVQYHNGVYDMVAADSLERLIVNGRIKKFYRYSEKRWITVGTDLTRCKTLKECKDIERRSRS
jgi:hypothetical protein